MRSSARPSRPSCHRIDSTVQERGAIAHGMGEKPFHLIGGRWSWVIVGIIVFGLLMGAREAFHSGWARAAVAGCAFAVLTLALACPRRRPRG